MKIYEKYTLNKYNSFNNCFFSTVMTVCDNLEIDTCKKGVALLYPYSLGNTTPLELYIEESVKNIAELLNISGVNYLTRDCTNNLTKTIINDIDNNRPVVLYIDCFYDSMSKFSFGRFHSRHYVIVSDYELKENCFWIVQHDYANENTYQYRKINFSELEKCYYRGRAYFKNDEPTYYWFYKSDDNCSKKLSNNSLLNTYKHSTFVLEQFLQFFFVCIKEKVSDTYLNPFVKSYSNILQVKKDLAMFYLEQFGDDDYLTNAVVKIAAAWEQLYQIITHKKIATEKLSKSISDILNCESSLCLKMEEVFM